MSLQPADLIPAPRTGSGRDRLPPWIGVRRRSIERCHVTDFACFQSLHDFVVFRLLGRREFVDRQEKFGCFGE